MGLFRRREEPLHERLLREGGLSVDATTDVLSGAADPLDRPDPPRSILDPAHGTARPREWDVAVTAVAPGLEGRELDFVVVQDGAVFMEDDLPEGSIEPLCDAVELKLRRPYRARAVRHDETLWAVSARSIRVVELRIQGNELELTVTRDGRELFVDGRESREALPELEQVTGLPAEYHARASRVDGQLWELDLVPL